MKTNNTTKTAALVRFATVGILLTLSLILLVAEGESASLWTLLTAKLIAAALLASSAALFRHWRLADNPHLRRFLSDD